MADIVHLYVTGLHNKNVQQHLKMVLSSLNLDTIASRTQDITRAVGSNVATINAVTNESFQYFSKQMSQQANQIASLSKQFSARSSTNDRKQWRQKKVCGFCKLSGHTFKDCLKRKHANKGTNEQSSGSTMTCFTCGKVGHMARDCYSRNNNRQHRAAKHMQPANANSLPPLWTKRT